MEAYKLFAKDVYTIFWTKKTFGIWIGWIHCLLFAVASVGFTAWAIYKIFVPYNYNNNYHNYYHGRDAFQNFNDRDAFFYYVLFFSVIMFVSGVVFIRAVQKSNIHKMLPFLLMSFVGIVTVSVFIANIQDYYFNIEIMNGICISLLVMHVVSFFWVLTRCLILRYTPEKLIENVDDVDKLLI